MLSSALPLLVFGGEIGGRWDGDGDATKLLGDPPPLVCVEEIYSGMLRGTIMGEIIESLRPKVLRGESIAPDGRKESEGCLDILSLLAQLYVLGCCCLMQLRQRKRGWEGKASLLMALVDGVEAGCWMLDAGWGEGGWMI